MGDPRLNAHAHVYVQAYVSVNVYVYVCICSEHEGVRSLVEVLDSQQTKEVF